MAALAIMLGASSALADCTIAITPLNGTNLGKIVANTTHNGVQDSRVPVTFTIPVGGGATTQSPAAGGTGVPILLNPPSNFRWQVTITTGASCSGAVTASLTATSGSFTFGPTFTIAAVSGITSLSTTTPANGANFTVNFALSGNNRIGVFNVGTAVVMPTSVGPGTVSWSTKATAQ